MTAPRVYADFQNLDDFNRLRLTCQGTLEDITKQGVHLKEGLVLTLYTDDADDQGRPDEMFVQGVVRYNVEEKCWVADIDWAAIRHASEESVNGAPSPPRPN